MEVGSGQDPAVTDGGFQAATRGLSDGSIRLGETVSRRHLRTGPLKAVVNDFFRWKLCWPFRRNEPDRFGKYRFHGDDYREVHIPYERWQREPSRYDHILVALGSEFRDAIELEQAESLLDEAVDRFVRMAAEGNVEQT